MLVYHNTRVCIYSKSMFRIAPDTASNISDVQAAAGQRFVLFCFFKQMMNDIASVAAASLASPIAKTPLRPTSNVVRFTSICLGILKHRHISRVVERVQRLVVHRLQPRHLSLLLLAKYNSHSILFFQFSISISIR